MQKLLILLTTILVGLLSNSCYKPVDGSGVIIEEERYLSGFNSVEFDGIGTLYINQGPLKAIKIITDDNFIHDIDTYIDGKNLKIFIKRKIAPTQLDIFLTFEDISQLNLKGSGNIICDSTITEKPDIWILNSGVGNININNLIAKNIIAILSNSGNIIINNGSCDYIKSKNYGYGNINFLGILTKRANVFDSSYGGTSINVSQYLKVEIKSNGNVWYKGNPQIDSTITGKGKLIKL